MKNRTSTKARSGTIKRYGFFMARGIKGSRKAPTIRIREGCRKLLVIVILTGHDAQMAEPFGHNDNEYAGNETKNGPETRDI